MQPVNSTYDNSEIIRVSTHESPDRHLPPSHLPPFHVRSFRVRAHNPTLMPPTMIRYTRIHFTFFRDDTGKKCLCKIRVTQICQSGNRVPGRPRGGVFSFSFIQWVHIIGKKTPPLKYRPFFAGFARFARKYVAKTIIHNGALACQQQHDNEQLYRTSTGMVIDTALA